MWFILFLMWPILSLGVAHSVSYVARADKIAVAHSLLQSSATTTMMMMMMMMSITPIELHAAAVAVLCTCSRLSTASGTFQPQNVVYVPPLNCS